MRVQAVVQRVPVGRWRFQLRSWGDAGSPVILLHGLASTGRIWDLVAPDLAADHRVYAPDQRGHGHSDKPAAGYDWERVSGDLIGLLDVLGLDRVVLAGHSWGADVALDVAARAPNRVARLVLIDGGLIDFRAHAAWPEVEALLTPPDLAGLTPEGLEELGPRWLGPAWRPEAAAIVRSLFDERPDGTLAPRLGRRQHLEIVRALWDHRPYELYPRVHCPVTVLLAIPPEPHDAYTSRLLTWRRAGLERLRESVSRLKFQVEVLSETVHDVPIQRPERVVAAIRTTR